MARLPRGLLPDGAYHVTTRGTNRRAIFYDDDDRRTFVNLLRLVVEAMSWQCHAYCLMTNHYHLVVETTRVALSKGMHRLNGRYAQGFNWRHGHVGHLFEGRYAVTVIERDRHLTDACDYVFANPVRAGLCAAADDWPWSGRLVRDLVGPA